MFNRIAPALAATAVATGLAACGSGADGGDAAFAPASAKLIVHDEVMVVYAATGKDRGTAVEKAVNGL